MALVLILLDGRSSTVERHVGCAQMQLLKVERSGIENYHATKVVEPAV